MRTPTKAGAFVPTTALRLRPVSCRRSGGAPPQAVARRCKWRCGIWTCTRAMARRISSAQTPAHAHAVDARRQEFPLSQRRQLARHRPARRLHGWALPRALEQALLTLEGQFAPGPVLCTPHSGRFCHGWRLWRADRGHRGRAAQYLSHCAGVLAADDRRTGQFGNQLSGSTVVCSPVNRFFTWWPLSPMNQTNGMPRLDAASICLP